MCKFYLLLNEKHYFFQRVTIKLFFSFFFILRINKHPHLVCFLCSLLSTTSDKLSATGTAYPSGAPEFTSRCSILSFLLFGHYIVCPWIYSLWLPLWYLHNFLSCILWFSIWLDASHIKKTYQKTKTSIYVCKYILKSSISEAIKFYSSIFNRLFECYTT